MGLSFKHAKTATTPDDGTSEVGSDEWNAEHTIVGIYAGTSFPSTPSAGWQCFRTDLGLDCYYDGARWLTKNEYTVGQAGADVLAATGTNDIAIGRWPVRQDYGIYLTTVGCTAFVLSTNNGSNYWVFTLQRRSGTNTSTNVGTASNTSADSVGNWVDHSIAVNAVLDSTARQLQLEATKVGGPGALYFACALSYRLIVT